ncbi:hypothetical protein VNO77_30195 [Canavalia gladiata]|uniref:Uncharacterized protein n=1 Tax=Canavalia gladiata TaxID=3824 RepID=A0AAN9KNK8_CANGL
MRYVYRYDDVTSRKKVRSIFLSRGVLGFHFRDPFGSDSSYNQILASIESMLRSHYQSLQSLGSERQPQDSEIAIP